MARYSQVKLFEDAAELLGGKGVVKRVAPTSPRRTGFPTDTSMYANIIDKSVKAWSDKQDKDAAKATRVADQAAARSMFEDYMEPQPAWKAEEYGSTPKTLRDAGFKVSMSDALGDQSLEGDEPADQNWMTADESKQFYNAEATKAQADFDAENPYGINALKDSYATANKPSMIDQLMGNQPPAAVEGEITGAMRMALMGDSARKRESDEAKLLAEQDARVKYTRGLEAEGRKADRTIAATALDNTNKVEAAKLERENPKGPSGRPSAAIQETRAMTALRLKLENEDLSPTERKRLETELLDLRTNIAKDPETKGKVAEARKTGTNIGEQNTKDFVAARNVVGNVKEIDFLISRLQATDGSILGFLTNLNLLKNRVMAKAGNQDALKKVNDAEMINSLSGKEVFELIKALGIGARGLDTPAERKFLRAVLTGTNELTKETLLEMAAERRKIQVRNVEKWNKRSNDGDYDRFYTSTGYIKRPLEVPGPAPVFTPVDISGDISKMNLVQLTAKMVGATKDEKLKIGLRLDALGAK
mgnify:CR=1 FL=1